jgi:hypothetical protein
MCVFFLQRIENVHEAPARIVHQQEKSRNLAASVCIVNEAPPTACRQALRI